MSGRASRPREHVDYSERDIIIPSPPKRKKGQSSGGGGAKKSAKAPPAPLLPNRAPLQEAPVTARAMGSAAIEAFLSSKVREQAMAIYQLSQLVYQGLVCDRVPEGDNKPLLFRAMLAGTSGCGKTESVNWVRHLLGMDAGYEYERQCVELDASTLDDEIQVNSVIGASAGLVGYGDGNSLPERLINALYDFRNTEWADVLRLDYESAERRRAEQTYKQRRAAMSAEELDAITPRYMMLFIDELDKASIKFIMAINSLIETGCYRTNAGIEFKLPRATRLFILYTSNYGDDAIARMEMRNLELAQQYVCDAMRESGLRPFSIARLERNICVYYPLAPGVLRRLLIDKLDEYIAQSAMAREFGSNTIRYEQDVKEFLVDRVIKAAQLDRGVRSPLDKLFANLGALFNAGLEKLKEAHRDKRIARPTPEDPIDLTLENFDCESLSNELQESWSPILKHIITDQRNEEVLALCRKHKTSGSALGMMLRNQPLCGTVYVNMGVHCQFDTDASTQKMEKAADQIEAITDDRDHWRGEAQIRQLEAQSLQRELVQTREAFEGIVEAIDTGAIDDARALAITTLDAVQQLEHATAAAAQPVKSLKRSKKAKKRRTEPKRARLTDANAAAVVPDDDDEPAVEEIVEDEDVVEEVVEEMSVEQDDVDADADGDNDNEDEGDGDDDDDDRDDDAVRPKPLGRRRKQITGFRYSHYHNHRAVYACNRCNGVCGARYVTSHHCSSGSKV